MIRSGVQGVSKFSRYIIRDMTGCMIMRYGVPESTELRGAASCSQQWYKIDISAYCDNELRWFSDWIVRIPCANCVVVDQSLGTR